MLLQTGRGSVASRCDLLASDFPRIFRNLAAAGAGPIGAGQWAFCANFACTVLRISPKFIEDSSARASMTGRGCIRALREGQPRREARAQSEGSHRGSRATEQKEGGTCAILATQTTVSHARLLVRLGKKGVLWLKLVSSYSTLTRCQQCLAAAAPCIGEPGHPTYARLGEHKSHAAYPVNYDGLTDQCPEGDYIRLPRAVISIKYGTHTAGGLILTRDSTDTMHAKYLMVCGRDREES
jgi:hypothetical protein